MKGECKLIHNMNFGFSQKYGTLVTDTSNSIDSAIFKNATRCPTYDTVLNWTIVYYNISTILG